MKQILQNLQTGQTDLADVPAPALRPGHLLVRTTRSLVSAGTERMLVEFGKANLIDKARQQPDKVRMVLDKVRTDGLAPTLAAVRNKLDQPIALGYCNVGRVLAIGHGVEGFAVGDRVASNGSHAEIVVVPVNLAVRVPDAVPDEPASFTVLTAIALQGLRLAAPTLGETVVVTGLGLIGLVTVQLLRANGCRVIALDFDAARLELARGFGAETIDLTREADPQRVTASLTHGRGVDAVLVTASTKSSEPMHQAALMCRKRGRIVLVGVTGLELSRADFFEKELTFQVSCSYGPGRYDPNYETKGLDYPIGFVRWTEQRNFEAALDLMARGSLDLAPLVTHRIPLEEAERAYAVVGGSEPSLGVVLTYSDATQTSDAAVSARTVAIPRMEQAAVSTPTASAPRLAIIGSGNYATGVLIPAFKAAGARLQTVVSHGGVSGVHAGRKYGFASASTDIDAVLADPTVDAVVIATRHDTHAALTVKALQAGKHVFVEKPLALDHAGVDAVEAALAGAAAMGNPCHLMVGFNRRFAPLTVKLRSLLGAGPRAMVMTVNAGAIPAEHWTQDTEAGGGRIVGEACHFVDLLRDLAASPLTAVRIDTMASPTGDTATIALTFANGSLGTVHYFANGHKSVAKERLEVYDHGRIYVLDNFIRLTGHGVTGFKSEKLWRQDKGQAACAKAFVAAIAQGRAPPIAPADLFEVSRAVLTSGRGSP